jgi:hypothetical protein
MTKGGSSLAEQARLSRTRYGERPHQDHHGYLVDRDDIDWFTLPLPTNPFSGVQYLPRGPVSPSACCHWRELVAKEYRLWLWHAGRWTRERPIDDQFGVELHSAE